MLKRILLAIAPVALIVGSVSADDDLLNSLAKLEGDQLVAVAADQDAADSDDGLGQSDVDALLGDDDRDEDAVAACFRRIGYGYGYGRSYRGYSYSYSYYRPAYSYRCYRPITYSYYHPVTYHVPVYSSYWACY